MSLKSKASHSHQNCKENLKIFVSPSQKTMGPPRHSLQLLQPSAVNSGLGRSSQVRAEKLNPKRKHLVAEQIQGPKRVKVEVKSTQTEETEEIPFGVSIEAYELMVRETPPSAYWKQVAEERRKALFNVLQDNEKLQKDIEAKDEEITNLQSENEELQELAQHVEYMADMIERLSGKSLESVEELGEITLVLEDDDDDDDDEEDYGGADQEEEPSDH